MLILRKEQIEVFARERRRLFEKKVLAKVRELAPTACVPYEPSRLPELIHNSINRAKTFGLTTESQMMKFIAVTLALSESFDELPRYAWAKEILEIQQFKADERIKLLCEVVSQDLPEQTS
ncbi:hypothetical protein [Coleofasciculus chthonoplastes]|nr:hypothetical protein [Coleofasciculus chthonoplastes]